MKASRSINNSELRSMKKSILSYYSSHPKYLTIRQASLYLEVDEIDLYRLIRLKKIKCYRPVAQKIYLHVNQLNNYLQETARMSYKEYERIIQLIDKHNIIPIHLSFFSKSS